MLSKIEIGDTVLVEKLRKSKTDPYYDPVPYKVTSKKGNRVTAERHDHIITRNIVFLSV